MNNRIIIFIAFITLFTNAIAQESEVGNLLSFKRSPEPFLFSVTTLTPQDFKWSLNYSGSYGERVQGPFGYNGITQQFALKGYLGKKFTLLANAALGISHNGKVTSAQQVEILRDFIGIKKNFELRIGAGLGANNDFTNAKSLLGRITASLDANRLKSSANLLLEHTFAENRDGIDVITNLGVHYRLFGNFYAGVEAVGEDLEGFWDEEEAEGGAKLMFGPSINMVSKKSGISFSLSGGPVLYATQNQISNPGAIRELPAQSGLILRAGLVFKLFGS